MSLIFATLVIRDPLFRETLRYTIQGVGLMFVFSFLIQDRGLSFTVLNNRFMSWMASISYTLYLVHLPMLVAWETLFGRSAAASGLALVSSLALSDLVRRLIEIPALQWRKRQFPSSPATGERGAGVVNPQTAS